MNCVDSFDMMEGGHFLGKSCPNDFINNGMDYSGINEMMVMKEVLKASSGGHEGGDNIIDKASSGYYGNYSIPYSSPMLDTKSSISNHEDMLLVYCNPLTHCEDPIVTTTTTFIDDDLHPKAEQAYIQYSYINCKDNCLLRKYPTYKHSSSYISNSSIENHTTTEVPAGSNPDPDSGHDQVEEPTSCNTASCSSCLSDPSQYIFAHGASPPFEQRDHQAAATAGICRQIVPPANHPQASNYTSFQYADPFRIESENGDHDLHELATPVNDYEDDARMEGGTYDSSMRASWREAMYAQAALQAVDWRDVLTSAADSRPKRRHVRLSSNPQTTSARRRRERISLRIRVLQRLVPGCTHMDTASMLDEAIHYLKFLKAQLQALI